MKYNHKKKAAVIAACACATAAFTVASMLPSPVSAASVSLVHTGSAFAGISVPLNNFYASRLEPEKELKEYLESQGATVSGTAETVTEESTTPEATESDTRESTQFSSQSQSQAVTQPQTQSQSQAAIQPQTQSQSQAATQPQTQSQSQAVTQTQAAGSGSTALAGAALLETQSVESTSAAETQAATQPETTTAPAETQAPSPYENIAITQVSNYVNIRDEASTEGNVVGKIYDNAAATILDTVDGEDGKWYYIQSGNVKGFMKAEYFVTGAEAETIAKEVGTVWARTTAVTLKLRKEPSTESQVITLLAQGETYLVREENLINEAGENFIEVLVNAGETEDDSLIGYISSDYADVYVEFEEAISKEEEEAELARIQRLKEEEEEARRRMAEEQRRQEEASRAAAATTTAPAPTEASAPSETGGAGETAEAPVETPAETQPETPAPTEAPAQDPAPSGGNGAARDGIVARAQQFVGNLPYVWGGTSLSTGADCSGFTYAIYREYGITLPRDAASQAAGSTSISRGDLLPGDLVFYSNGSGYINHVAIYIGGGSVVHETNRATGVRISSMDYATPVKYGRYIQ